MPEHQSIPVPDGSVVITPAQQYAELRALTEAVRDLSGKVDPALADLRSDVDENKADIKELRTELSALQKWRYGISGALVLLASLVGWGALNLTNLGG